MLRKFDLSNFEKYENAHGFSKNFVGVRIQPYNYVLYETCTVGLNEIQSLAQTRRLKLQFYRIIISFFKEPRFYNKKVWRVSMLEIFV